MQLFSLKPGRSIWREIGDQSLHVLYASCLMSAFIFPVPAWGAAILVMLVAFERELEQKDWDVSRVGRQDLIFWALGTAVTAVALYII